MKTLLLDIETSPNLAAVWGLFGVNIALNQLIKSSATICFAGKWHGEDKKPVFRSLYHHGKDEMLGKVWSMLEEADAVVTYNGIRFDIPTLNKEFLKAQMPPPPPSYNIDLFRTVKKNFRFTSMKLDHVANELGIKGKLEHKGMALWLGCMEMKPSDWKVMKDYNIQDINMLGEVYERLLPWIKDHPNMAHFGDGKAPVCPSCGSHKVEKRGFFRTQTMTYQRYRCQGCGSWSKARTNNLTPQQRKNILAKI